MRFRLLQSRNLKAGRIIEEGPHRELLARGGAYATLWNRQMGGFIDAA
jgi:ABC-type multidrug transport system fused ATPase/permease subunit